MANVTTLSTITRVADTNAYVTGDLIGNSTTAGSVTVANGGVFSWSMPKVVEGTMIAVKARLRKSGTGVSGAAFRLHLLNTVPTFTNGDNGALVMTGSSGYIGSVDFTAMVTNGAGSNLFSDGAGGNGAPSVGSVMVSGMASTQTIYGVLEARGSYPPASAETFTVTLEFV